MRKILSCLITLMLLCFFAACSDEESFSTSTSNRLTFSDDTVSFDTVLTNVGSSTKRVRVFNNNNDGIRIKNVRLGSGGTSGFRINVDGQSGVSLNDVEILKKDSIFMFIDLTAQANDSNTPVAIKDSIIFTLESGVTQQMILQAEGQDVITLQGKRYAKGENAILTATRPYLIYDSLKVDSGATLTIEAGATLFFHSKTSIIVDGTLNIKGTADKMVTLRGDRTDRMFTYLPYDRIDGQWGGIYFTSKSVGNTIEYADIHGGDNAIVCDESGTDKCKVSISNSIIHNFNGYCVYSVNNKMEFENTQISNARKNCLNFTGGLYTFNYCTIAQFNAFHSDRGYAFYGWNYVINEKNDSIAYPLDVNMVNTIVTGYSTDEIIVAMPYSKAPYILSFDYCLLNTDITGMDKYITINVSNCNFDTKDNEVYRAKNFKCVDTSIYMYDFHLDSLSLANNKSKEGKNIGCYQ